ncbi:DUF3084 domain-containing protein [Calothrix sp. 336/3]|uniref:DUF3084 domain-containing protein n=1 Tax=Calothrix sp. 336/3 TaxID=1337936 RepID=UPI0004E41761|nr:DUF3084 domain-containing protein [Calothrix sp. 336/3]AKG24066.1 hypothetical protein IJ00_24590 [Calothrix sp. 336/3]
MATGYILIVAILILGGVIATVGDRIGTKVGKKRLSLFNLRPKNTAVLITILTGLGISASTLGILFLADEGLRKGVFELQDIQKDLRRKREQLKNAEAQKSQVEGELNQAKQQEAQAQKSLERTNKNLQEANIKQKKTQAQLNRTIVQEAATKTKLQKTQNQLGQVVSQYQQAISQLQSVYNERNKQLAEIARLKQESQTLYEKAQKAINQAKAAIALRDRELAKSQEAIEQRDKKISRLDRLIQERNLVITAREQIIAKREIRLKELEQQQDYLEQEVSRLEKSYQDLRVGKLALIRYQVITAGVIRAVSPAIAQQAIVRLLDDANRIAQAELTGIGTNNSPNQATIEITRQRVEQLSQKISNGQEYVVRILSAGNYVRGEKRIEIVLDATPNVLLFKKGETLATNIVDPKTSTPEQLRQRVNQLIAASEFRARNAGILQNIQIDGRTFIAFMNQLQTYQQPLDIKAIAAEDTFTVGPLRLKFVGMQNGEILFST